MMNDTDACATRGRQARVLGLGLLAVLAVPLVASATRLKCCFNNPQYSGTCVVQPTGDETCGSILEYLNNPLANGKDYCSGTQVRGHWTQVSCASPSPSESGLRHPRAALRQERP